MKFDNRSKNLYIIGEKASVIILEAERQHHTIILNDVVYF